MDELMVPDYCFRVECSTPGKPNVGGSANGILLERERGWFAVNNHFVTVGSEHFVFMPHTGKSHRLIVHKHLINKLADVALVCLEDRRVIPCVPVPEFASPPSDMLEELWVAGRQRPADRTISAKFLMYPVSAGHIGNPIRFDDYEHSIMFCMNGNCDDINGLSGSPLVNSAGKIVGILTQSKLSIAFATPACEITSLLKRALSKSGGGFFERWCT